MTLPSYIFFTPDAPTRADGDQPGENPRCPICDEQMTLVRERFGPDYWECRNVECPNPDRPPVTEEEGVVMDTETFVFGLSKRGLLSAIARRLQTRFISINVNVRGNPSDGWKIFIDLSEFGEAATWYCNGLYDVMKYFAYDLDEQ